MGSGKEFLRTAYEKYFKDFSETVSPSAEPAKRILIEPKRSDRQQITYALDYYKEEKSPGFGPTGLEGKTSHHNIFALYQVSNNLIQSLWISTEEHDTVAKPNATKDDITQSNLWRQVLEVMRRKVKGGAKIYYNNYSVYEDTSGLGLGSANSVETWRQDI